MKIVRNLIRSDWNWRCWVNDECYHYRFMEYHTCLVDRYRYFVVMWQSHRRGPKS